MCYTRRKIQGGVGALRESDDTNFLEPNGQSRNLNVYGWEGHKHALRFFFEPERLTDIKFPDQAYEDIGKLVDSLLWQPPSR